MQLEVGKKLIAENNRSNRKEPILCVVHGGGCSSEVIDQLSAKTITTGVAARQIEDNINIDDSVFNHCSATGDGILHCVFMTAVPALESYKILSLGGKRRNYICA